MISMECPEGLCVWCWEHGKEVEATTDDGELCEDCAFERSVAKADALYDRMRDGE